MNIVALLNQVHNEEIVLPAIQRDFVWNEEKIEKLMDSIMRGYPIGIVLMWETFNDLQFRKFEKSYKKDNRPTFFDNTVSRKLRVVLDGQQRLQSLYIALYGKYNNKYLYFNILSGKESNDFEEDKYHFYFLTAEEANEWNNEAMKSDSCEYYEKVSDLFKMDVLEKQRFRKAISKQLHLDEEDELRMETNQAPGLIVSVLLAIGNGRLMPPFVTMIPSIRNLTLNQSY